MIIIRRVDEMINLGITLRKAGKRIGFVPTMGALHEGHLSLLNRARACSDITITSIFVNPAQFGPNEDFQRYPRSFEKDVEAARGVQCDYLFAPDEKEMYPKDDMTKIVVSDITARLEGALRPGHFDGVTTVVYKLLRQVQPHTLFLGQKDAQQVIVIKRMVQDLIIPVDVRVCPTVREPDGLALSSRNQYLAPEERKQAPAIFQGLQEAQLLFSRGERNVMAHKEAIRKRIDQENELEIQYAEIVDTKRLNPLDTLDQPALAAVACRTGISSTRLIDNVLLGGEL